MRKKEKKEISKTGQVHEDAKIQKTKSLVPLHVQMMQENEQLQEFLLIVVIGNTLSTLAIFLCGFLCMKCVRYVQNTQQELEELRLQAELRLQPSGSDPETGNGTKKSRG